MPREEILREMLATDPANSFARYGLAMEMANTERPGEAVAEFQALMEANPDYTATYYHYGQTLEKLGRIEDARAVYESGVAVTSRTGDAHARGELEAVLAMLPL